MSVAVLVFVLVGTLVAVPAAGAGPAPGAGADPGYWMLTRHGEIFGFGGAAALGTPPAGRDYADIESTPSGHGYWVLGADGTMWSFGDAPFLPSGPALAGHRYTSLSITASGDGAWLFADSGKVIALGNAAHYGDMSGIALNGPVLNSVATPSGHGYWMVASDGGIFSFGDARFFGSMGGAVLNKPVVSMAPDPDGTGYWLVASDGGIFAFGAPFYGSMGGTRINQPVKGMVAGGTGYLMVAQDGGIFSFGDSPFYGSLGNNPPSSPIVAVAVIKDHPIVLGPAKAPKDVTPPETTIASGPTGLTASDSAAFTFTASEAGSTFECRLDSAAFAPCSSPVSYSGLAQGAHAFDVRATDKTGNTDPSPDHRAWNVDTAAPDTTIDTGPSANTSSASATFTFSADEAGSTFECRLDGAAFAPCTTPKNYTGLAVGAHSFDVRATDPAGNVDPTPDHRDWTIDMTAPETTIGSGPSGIIATTSAAFTFSADKAGSTFECRLDGGTFAPCTSPKTYSGLAQGAHAFDVRATDKAGNTDPTPDHRAWTVDTVAPDTTIDSGPSGTTGTASAAFTFSATETGSTFECRLDSAAFAPCTSPKSYTTMTLGAHTFEARATDSAGNTDPSPAQRTWTYQDTVPPETTIDAGPSGTISNASTKLTFSSNEEGSTFECRLDGAAFAPCTSPKSYSGLAESAHTFEVRAIDPAGNVDPTPASRSWTVGPTPVLFTDGFESGNLAAWRIGADGDGRVGVQRTQVRRGSYAALLSASSASTSMGYARWVPAAPETDLSVSGDFQINTEGAAGSNVPIFRLFDPSGTAVVSLYRQNQSNDRIWVQHSGSTYDLTNGVLPLSTWARFEVHVVAAGAGASTLEVRLNGALVFQTTAASLGTAGIATVQIGYEVRGQAFSLTADDIIATRGAALDTLLDAGPTGSLGTGSAHFAFSATDADATFECHLDGADFAPCTSPTDYTAVPEGAHSFEVRAVDANGNVDLTPVSRSWTVDLTPPDTTIVHGPSGTVTTNSATLSFAATEDGSRFECRVDAAPFAACTSPATYTGLAEGDHRFEVRAIDPAGNVDPSPDGLSWVVDTPALFSDGFEHNAFTGWTAVRTDGDGSVGVQSAQARAGAFAARLSAGGSPTSMAYARWGPAAPETDLGVSGDFQVNTEGASGSNVPLLRLFDPSGTALVSLYRQNQSFDRIWVQHSGTTYDMTSAVLPLDTWGRFEVHVVTAGAGASTLEVRLNGDLDFRSTTASLGTAGVGTVQIGYEVRGQAFALTADDILVLRGIAPDTVIDSGPSGIVASPSATFAFSSPDATSTFQCRLDDAALADCTSPATFDNLAEGSHTFEVVATNAVGNPDPTPAVRTWTYRQSGPPDKLLIADHRNLRLIITDFNGKLIWEFDNPTGRTDGDSGPLGVRWLPGNRILATFGTGEVGLIDVATKTWLWQTSGYGGDWFRSPYDAELLPDGNLAVAMRFNSGGRIDVYDLRTGQLVWRHLLSNAHAVKYRSAEQSYNSPYPTLLVGGWGATQEVAYAPLAGETGQTVSWSTTTEYTHDVVVLDNDDLLTTEGYYIQRITRQGTVVWKQNTPVELRRVAVDPTGGLVYSGAEANQIEFRTSGGDLVRSWSFLSDGSHVQYPYGIQIIDYLM